VIALVRWLVVTEIHIWRSLFLWVTRRVPGKGPGVEAFSYTRELAPLIGVFIFLSLIELPVVHLLLPWDTIRLVVLVLSVWGVLWMVGYLAGVRVFPHLLDAGGLRLRYGPRVDIRIPMEAIASITARRGSVTSGEHVQVDGTVLDVAVVKQTRVEVVLHGPTTLGLPDGPAEITRARFYADDPRGLVTSTRERLEVPFVQDRGRPHAVQRGHER
jgi:hypothetical protein